jgi:S1-C subfamily serine protease
MMMTLSRRGALLVMIGLAALTGRSSHADDLGDYAKILKEKEPTLVTVKFVLKVKMGGMMGGMGDQESDTEITGVLIDAKGLVLCSNTQLGGFTAMMKRMMGRMGGDITATPTDLKVLIGDDVEGVEAELIARDTELDLAWVRIKEPAETPYPHVDFGAGAEVDIGDRVFAVREMGKYFGRTPVVTEGRIGGKASKPRELYIPSADFATAMGMPVYNANGQIVGIMVMQMPMEEDADMNPMAMMGMMSSMQDMMGGFILPAANVAKATSRAMEVVESP